MLTNQLIQKTKIKKPITKLSLKSTLGLRKCRKIKIKFFRHTRRTKTIRQFKRGWYVNFSLKHKLVFKYEAYKGTKFEKNLPCRCLERTFLCAPNPIFFAIFLKISSLARIKIELLVKLVKKLHPFKCLACYINIELENIWKQSSGF